MSFFVPRFNDFHGLSRLAEELDRASRQTSNHHHRQSSRTFAPKFDVKETRDSYELHGDLPGIEQENINIEWGDENTLSIFGKTETRIERSSNGNATPEEVEKTGVDVEAASPDSSSEQYHKPTVEEEGEEGELAPTSKVPEPQAVAKVDTANRSVAKPKARYWVAERSVGSFHRTFTFPGRVDRDAVKASLKNGVLSIVIPKAKALEPKKISIN